MEEKSSAKLNVLDLVIAVLRQHEKSLDEKLAQFETMLKRLEKISSDMIPNTEQKGYFPLPLEETPEENEPFNRGRTFIDKNFGRKQGFSKPLQRPSLHKVEVKILKLIAAGEPVEEIALRLNMDPLDVKEIIADLAQKGYLYPKSLH
jgi:DNA-binding CsgD family transcriptional regulator